MYRTNPVDIDEELKQLNEDLDDAIERITKVEKSPRTNSIERVVQILAIALVLVSLITAFQSCPPDRDFASQCIRMCRDGSVKSGHINHLQPCVCEGQADEQR